MAAAAVEPAVGSETQAVGKVVIARAGHVEAVKDRFGRSVRNIIAVPVRQEEQSGWADRPEAAVANLDAGEHLQRLGEDFAVIKLSVTVGVAEDQHAVPQRKIEPAAGFGVGVILGYPEPTPRIPGHRDWIAHLWLGGHHGCGEAGREFD